MTQFRVQSLVIQGLEKKEVRIEEIKLKKPQNWVIRQ